MRVSKLRNKKVKPSEQIIARLELIESVLGIPYRTAGGLHRAIFMAHKAQEIKDKFLKQKTDD